MFGPENSKPRIDAVLEQLRPDWSQVTMPETPVTMDVAVPGGKLHVAVLGGGMPVVCLHGWALDNRMWRGIWSGMGREQFCLANDHQLIIPDRRGFGRSTAPPDLASEYRDIDYLVPNGPLILVGFSQGASVAMDYARRCPDRVAAMVLVGAPLPSVIDSDPDSSVPLRQYRALVEGGQIAEMRALWAGHPLMQTKADCRSALSAILSDYGARDLENDASTILITADDVSQFSMPVLAVAGAKEPQARRQVAKYIGESAPRGSHAEIAGAGHMCLFDNPSAFNQTLDNFIRSHSF